MRVVARARWPLGFFRGRFYVAPPRWRSPARYQEKPGCTSTVRTRVLRGSELSSPFLGARGGRYFVYLSHAGEEVFRRFWGFPPPINDSSLADSCRLCSTTRGFIISVSLSTVHQFDCEIPVQFAQLRVDFVSFFSLPLSLPVICFGVYCTAGFSFRPV